MILLPREIRKKFFNWLDVSVEWHYPVKTTYRSTSLREWIMKWWEFQPINYRLQGKSDACSYRENKSSHISFHGERWAAPTALSLKDTAFSHNPCFSLQIRTEDRQFLLRPLYAQIHFCQAYLESYFIFLQV